MLAYPAFCELAYVIGVASLAADDAQIWHLTKLYWQAPGPQVARPGRRRLPAWVAPVHACTLAHTAECVLAMSCVPAACVHGIVLASARCGVLLSRYTVEFGVVREASGIKAFGAGKSAPRLRPCPCLLSFVRVQESDSNMRAAALDAGLVDGHRMCLVCRHSVKLWRDGAHGAGARKAAAL